MVSLWSASCDLVLYFKVGKAALGVIEVDGEYHGTARQAERNVLKGSILRERSLPFFNCRLSRAILKKELGSF